VTRRQAEPFVTDEARKVFVTPAYYELTYGRNHSTVRKWADKQQVRSMWSGDVFYVHLDDCRKLDAKCATQDRRKKETA
jgi:hypothetical protein